MFIYHCSPPVLVGYSIFIPNLSTPEVGIVGVVEVESVGVVGGCPAKAFAFSNLEKDTSIVVVKIDAIKTKEKNKDIVRKLLIL